MSTNVMCSKVLKTLNICGIKFSRFNENDILVYFNFVGHDIPWFQIVKKFSCKFVSRFAIKLYIMSSIRIASSRRF